MRALTSETGGRGARNYREDVKVYVEIYLKQADKLNMWLGQVRSGCESGKQRNGGHREWAKAGRQVYKDRLFIKNQSERDFRGER